MKTSTKLLIGLFLLLVAAMFGAGASLRSQYNSIDKTDRFARWRKTPLPPFRAIRVVGPTRAAVHIEASRTSRLLIDTLDRDWPQLKGQLSARVQNDTLLLLFKPDPASIPNSNSKNRGPSLSVRVECPQLAGLLLVDAGADLSGFREPSLTISQQGERGELTLTNTTFQTLTATLFGATGLTISEKSRIEQAAITLRDNSHLVHHQDFSKSFRLDAAPGTTVELTGKALQQIKQAQ